MPAVASKSKSGRSKASPGQPPFTVESYEEYLRGRPKIRNEVARENPDKSIFDAMMSIDGELQKKVCGGRSVRDIFKKSK